MGEESVSMYSQVSGTHALVENYGKISSFVNSVQYLMSRWVGDESVSTSSPGSGSTCTGGKLLNCNLSFLTVYNT